MTCRSTTTGTATTHSLSRQRPHQTFKMNVSIALQHPHDHYTNLDVIQGNVVLRVPNPTNISSIVVKLEGESKTRLLAPIHPSRPDKQRPVLEVHKFLYKTNTLFPTNVRPEDLVANPKASFAINAGTYEYPFQFKVGNRRSIDEGEAKMNSRYPSTHNVSSRPTRFPTFPSRMRCPSSRDLRRTIPRAHSHRHWLAFRARQRSNTL